MYSPPKISWVISGIKYICLHLLSVLYLIQPSSKQIICFDFQKNCVLPIVLYVPYVYVNGALPILKVHDVNIVVVVGKYLSIPILLVLNLLASQLLRKKLHLLLIFFSWLRCTTYPSSSSQCGRAIEVFVIWLATKKNFQLM